MVVSPGNPDLHYKRPKMLSILGQMGLDVI